MRHLRRTGQARRRDLARTIYYLWRYKLGLLDIERAVAVSLGWIRGRDEAAVRADCRSWYERIVRRYLRPAMVATVEAHRRAGHLPVILTSATRYLAEPVAADLGIEHLLVTQLRCATGASRARPCARSATARARPGGRSASPPRGGLTWDAATSTRTRSPTCPCSSGSVSHAS